LGRQAEQINPALRLVAWRNMLFRVSRSPDTVKVERISVRIPAVPAITPTHSHAASSTQRQDLEAYSSEAKTSPVPSMCAMR